MIRLSIVKGQIPGLEESYTVNIGPNLDKQVRLAKKFGTFDEEDIFS